MTNAKPNLRSYAAAMRSRFYIEAHRASTGWIMLIEDSYPERVGLPVCGECVASVWPSRLSDYEERRPGAPQRYRGDAPCWSCCEMIEESEREQQWRL